MGELLFELLLAIAQLLLDVLLELVGTALLDVASRAVASVFEDSEISNPSLAFFGYALLGALTGALSLLIFPHHLLRPSRIHGISLVISPLVTGAAMSLVGSMLRKHEKRVVRIESFGYGCVFAFAMALMRLVFAK
jgi:hypothetical protein